MNELKVIKQQEVLGQDFKIYGDFDNPLFLAKDVAEWIEHNQPSRIASLVDDDEKVMRNVHTPGGNQSMWFLTEDGLYEVLMQSRKPIAKSFKKEVKAILKDVRKHGAYMTPETIENVLTDPDTIIKLATNLKEEQTKRREAELKIEQDKPKVLFADALTTSTSSILVGELAKLLKQNGVEIGQNKLFDWLRDNGYLIKKRGELYNLPTQRSMELGLMDIKKRVINDANGSSRITRTTKVTGKGQQYFINKFLKDVS